MADYKLGLCQVTQFRSSWHDLLHSIVSHQAVSLGGTVLTIGYPLNHWCIETPAKLFRPSVASRGA